MASKKRQNDLRTSLEALRHIDWLNATHDLPAHVDKELLDQCSDMIQEFIDNERSFSEKQVQPTSKSRKRPTSKTKSSKIKATTKLRAAPKTRQHKKLPHRLESRSLKSNRTKAKSKSIKKHIAPLHLANTSSTNAYPCYPSAFPCFRTCGPIQCPKNKLPMPRDLWYRIVYSQALEQQSDASRKRKTNEDQSEEDGSSVDRLRKNKSTGHDPRRQQTMNAALSWTTPKITQLDSSSAHIDDHYKTKLQNPSDSAKLDGTVEWSGEALGPIPPNSRKPCFMKELEYVLETLPLETEAIHSRGNLLQSEVGMREDEASLSTRWKTTPVKALLCSQSAHVQLTDRPMVHRGMSADATLERIASISTAPSVEIIRDHQQAIEPSISSPLQVEPSLAIISKENSCMAASVVSDHPLFNQLIESYHLQDISRHALLKRLNRRLAHIQQTLENLTSHDIETKLKSKRDALVNKRQTPVPSLTKDERMAMAELELNVHEYVKALDQPRLTGTPALASLQSTVSLRESLAPSVSTLNTIRSSAISQSTALRSTTTRSSEKTEKFASWNHPLLPSLLNSHLRFGAAGSTSSLLVFKGMTAPRKVQMHKRLARRYEHICAKAKEFSAEQLETQIASKAKALEQNKSVLAPNEDDRLRIAELELCLFELEREQNERKQSV